MVLGGLLALMSLPATANEYLKGLKEMGVVVSGVDEASVSCGLNADGLRSALMLPVLAYTKMQERNDSTARLSLSVMTLQNAMGCVSFLDVRLFQIMDARLPHQSETRAVSAYLYGHAMIRRTEAVKHNDDVASALQAAGRRLAEAWVKANR
jgi:hypothetical protein